MSSFRYALALVATAGSLLAADPGLMALIGPEAQVVGGINVDRAAVSPFGQFMLSQIPQEDAGMRKFIDATGFDPRRDLKEVVFAGSSANRNNGLVLARGAFDPAKFTATLTKQAGATLSSYHGTQVLVQSGGSRAGTGNAGKTAWIAFLDSRTAIAGDSTLVQGAIDRKTASGRAIDPKLSAKADEVSGKYDAWMVSALPVSALAGKVPDKQLTGPLGGAMNGELIQSIEQTSGGILFGSSILIGGEAVTHTEKDATALADVIRFLAGMAQMNTQNQPNTAPLAAILSTLDLKAVSNVMQVSITVPEAQLEKLLKPATRREAGLRKVQYNK